MRIFPLVIGVYFGIVLVKSQVASLVSNPQDVPVRGSAHVPGPWRRRSPSGLFAILIIRHFGVHTISGDVAELKKKGFHKGVIAGGILFGMGWVITGACPGPIFAQLGNGEWAALATFAGAFAGAYLYALARPKLPH